MLQYSSLDHHFENLVGINQLPRGGVVEVNILLEDIHLGFEVIKGCKAFVLG